MAGNMGNFRIDIPTSLTTKKIEEAQRLQAEEAAKAKQTASVHDSVRNMAKDFRTNLGGYKTEQYGLAARQGAGKLKENLGLIKRGSNQRGLLFSGLRQGAEGNARASMAALLANQRAQINTDANALADTYDNQAATLGLANYGDSVKRSEDAFRRSQEAAEERRRMISELSSGVGYGLGSIAASKKGA